MAETLLTELAGVPVYERSERSGRPRCCFEIALADDTAQTEQGQDAENDSLRQLDEYPNLIRTYHVPAHGGKSEVRPSRDKQEDGEYGTAEDIPGKPGQQKRGDYHRHRSKNGAVYQHGDD